MNKSKKLSKILLFLAVSAFTPLLVNGQVLSTPSGTTVANTAGYSGIGIGTQTPNGAQLHIMGTGNTSGTYNFTTTNSSGTELFKISDNGRVSINNAGFSGRLTLNDNAPSGSGAAGILANVSSVSGSLITYGMRANIDGEGMVNYGYYSNVTKGGTLMGASHYSTYNGTATTARTIYGLSAQASQTVTISGSTIYGIYATASASSGGNTVYAGYFSGNVYSTGSYLPSDRKLKSNIAPYTGALSQINKIRLTTYDFNAKAYPGMHLPESKQIGVISEEFEQVFPDLVKKTVSPEVIDADGKKTADAVEFKAVNYVGLVPVLVAGMQEQQGQINDLKAEITELRSMVNKLANQQQGNLQGSMNKATLNQNVPNPANNTSSISYYLPNADGQAYITVTDIAGRTEYFKTNVQGGNGQVIIPTSGMAAGTYIYSLIVNGEKIDSKKMVIIK